MKLVWAIVQNEDAARAVNVLVEKKHQVTRINTVGGFLRRGNVTLLVGVEAEQVDDVIATLRETCRARGPASDMPAPRARAVVMVIDASSFIRV